MALGTNNSSHTVVDVDNRLENDDISENDETRRFLDLNGAADSDSEAGFANFQVKKWHLPLIIKYIIAIITFAEWSLIMEVMLPNHICEDIKNKKEDGLKTVVQLTLQKWLLTTENRMYSDLISFFEGHTKLTENLKNLSYELKGAANNSKSESNPKSHSKATYRTFFTAAFIALCIVIAVIGIVFGIIFVTKRGTTRLGHIPNSTKDYDSETEMINSKDTSTVYGPFEGNQTTSSNETSIDAHIFQDDGNRENRQIPKLHIDLKSIFTLPRNCSASQSNHLFLEFYGGIRCTDCIIPCVNLYERVSCSGTTFETELLKISKQFKAAVMVEFNNIKIIPENTNNSLTNVKMNSRTLRLKMVNDIGFLNAFSFPLLENIFISNCLITKTFELEIYNLLEKSPLGISIEFRNVDFSLDCHNFFGLLNKRNVKYLSLYVTGPHLSTSLSSSNCIGFVEITDDSLLRFTTNATLSHRNLILLCSKKIKLAEVNVLLESQIGASIFSLGFINSCQIENLIMHISVDSSEVNSPLDPPSINLIDVRHAQVNQVLKAFTVISDAKLISSTRSIHNICLGNMVLSNPGQGNNFTCLFRH